ncbi:MAG: hypothetical protein IPO87_11990 [Flavobacteriales bacterium]|nr:hypothetical protein [Flavobacteriales bacterium]
MMLLVRLGNLWRRERKDGYWNALPHYVRNGMTQINQMTADVLCHTSRYLYRYEARTGIPAPHLLGCGLR